MAENFPVDSFYLSIGLWGNKDHIDPETFSGALSYALKGKNLYPGHPGRP